jgi:tetratricopeptide (TPR) repeat protein
MTKRGWTVLGLAVMTVVVYSRVPGLDFVRWDDQLYVTENANVLKGLHPDTIAWAFGFHVSNWHPLTWLSHMADAQLFGLDPAGHHVVSLLLHVLNVALLFLVLDRMTGKRWTSAFVAAFFAVHPLHVESVAWVSERKELLCTLFMLLALGAYREYAAFPGRRRYLVLVAFFILGLMAKPMLVTLPFVLLLLDFWPLGRMEAASKAGEAFGGVGRLAVEKIPLFLISAASCAITYSAQSMGRAVTGQFFPLDLRVYNAVLSCARYIGKMFYPAALSMYYPYDPSLPAAWEVAVAIGLLAAICAACFLLRDRLPYLFVGWFFFLGTLVPVIGLVQVGNQAMADRYTYIPLTGLFIALCFGVEALSRRLRLPGAVPVAAGVAALLCLGAVAWRQVGYWQDSLTLFRHAVEVTRNNDSMMEELGVTYYREGMKLLEQGNAAGAVPLLREANRYRPYDPGTLFNLGFALSAVGGLEESARFLQMASDINPSHEETRVLLGQVRDRLGSAGKNGGPLRGKSR